MANLRQRMQRLEAERPEETMAVVLVRFSPGRLAGYRRQDGAFFPVEPGERVDEVEKRAILTAPCDGRGVRLAILFEERIETE